MIMYTCISSLELKVCVIRYYFLIQIDKVLYDSFLIDLYSEEEGTN